MGVRGVVDFDFCKKGVFVGSGVYFFKGHERDKSVT